MTGEILLDAKNLRKSYAGVLALKSASLEVRAGEVHALVGENGAGKSTLVKIITGAVESDGGTLVLNGETIESNSPRAARHLGIAAIYQQPALFAELTVAENIALGNESEKFWGRVDWRGRHERAAKLLEQVGARIPTTATAGELSMPEQQLVEIARAVGADARLLILDEPTASLAEEEAQNLFSVIGDLRRRGVGMIYISHRLEELPLIADRVTVLRDGESIVTKEMADVDRQELVRLMVGRELDAVFPKRDVVPGSVVMEIRRLGNSVNGVHNVNLTLRAGEIVGLAGMVGSGRTELARTIFGLEPASDGEILINGEAVVISTPRDAIEKGIAYVPEDRRRHGVVLEMPISQNVSLASLDRLSAFGALDRNRESALALEYIERFSIKSPSVFAPAGTLSGGNQQKVALSRWLATNPRVLILDEPTQGIDVGSKAEIHSLMCELAAQGMAILMISSELPEVLGMSDRIAIMHEGTIVSVLPRADASPQKVLSVALGQEKI